MRIIMIFNLCFRRYPLKCACNISRGMCQRTSLPERTLILALSSMPLVATHNLIREASWIVHACNAIRSSQRCGCCWSRPPKAWLGCPPVHATSCCLWPMWPWQRVSRCDSMMSPPLDFHQAAQGRAWHRQTRTCHDIPLPWWGASQCDLAAVLVTVLEA